MVQTYQTYQTMDPRKLLAVNKKKKMPAAICLEETKQIIISKSQAEVQNPIYRTIKISKYEFMNRIVLIRNGVHS